MLIRSATIVPIRELGATVEFYRDILGFEALALSFENGFARVQRDGVEVMLTVSDDDEALRATANNIAVYIWVEDVDALFAALAEKLETLPEGRLRRPFDQPYGTREFHVKDPDGCLLFFGMGIDGPAKA